MPWKGHGQADGWSRLGFPSPVLRVGEAGSRACGHGHQDRAQHAQSPAPSGEVPATQHHGQASFSDMT